MDKKRFVDTVVSLTPRLRHIATGVVHDTEVAADLVQETLLRLWIRRKELSAYRSVEALSVTMIRHLAIDYLRTNHEYETLTAIEHFSSGDHGSDTLESREVAVFLKKAIEDLPELQRLTFRLKEVEGYEAAEIAEITGVNINAVYNNLSRARSSLRHLLLTQNIYPPYANPKR